MKFCFLKAAKSVAAVSAFTFALTSLCAIAAGAQEPAGQSGQPAGQQAQKKNYKDRGEYEIYSKVTQATDPKARLELLNTWQDKYPTSDFKEDRLQYFVATLGQLAGSDPSQRQPLIDKCQELLKADPKNFTGNYYIALFGQQVPSPSPDLVTQVKSAADALVGGLIDTTFAPDKKKPNMTDEQWAKAKNAIVSISHNALAWVATQNKDSATAQNEYKKSLEANPDQGTVSALYAKSLIDDKKYPEGLFEYARAAQYEGPGPAVASSTRAQLLSYFNNAYKGYHGSAEGADQVLAQAKTSALPPAGFTIVSANQIAQQNANKLNERIASDPAFKIWFGIKQSLVQQGDDFFNNSVKGFEIPGGANGVENFTGTVISINPPDQPTQVVVGVEDATKPDATLTFSKPLPADALNVIKVGSQIQFSGVADSYVKDPYMLTFKDPKIPGVKTATPPAPAHRGRRRR